MELEEILSKAIESRLNLDGVKLGFTKEVIKELYELDKLETIIDLNKYIEDEKIELYNHASAYDLLMFLYNVKQMLTDAEIKLELTEKIQDENKKYLESFLKEEKI